MYNLREALLVYRLIDVELIGILFDDSSLFKDLSLGKRVLQGTLGDRV